MNMNVKESVIEVENMAEEKANRALNQVQDVTRKSYYAYLGMWRMIYDGAVDTVSYSRRMFDKVIKRGEGIEQGAIEEAQEVVTEVESRADKVQQRIKKRLGRSERQLADQIEAALKRLDVPGQSTLLELNDKIDMLNKKIDSIMAVQMQVVIEQPMPRYDKLTAKEIVSKLGGLTMNDLVKVKQYEMAHEDRVTVLREVDRRLEAMPIARYDELTVEEIEPLLAALDAAQLQVVAEYEAAHENRVTLLRAVDDELESRKMAAAD